MRDIKIPCPTLDHKMPEPVLNKNGRVGPELLLHIPSSDNLIITISLLFTQVGNLSLSDRQQRVNKNAHNRTYNRKQSSKIRDRVNLPIPDSRHSLHLQPHSINLIIEIVSPSGLDIRFLKIPDDQPKDPHGRKQQHHTPKQRLLSQTSLKRKHPIRLKTVHIANPLSPTISPHTIILKQPYHNIQSTHHNHTHIVINGYNVSIPPYLFLQKNVHNRWHVDNIRYTFYQKFSEQVRTY